MNSLKEFFWFCSGASPELLKRCPTENSKYTGIGASVLFTGIFAALAAGYALFTVFDSWLPALIFGILWGAMIFNLDRYIVSSMKKEGNIWKEIHTAVPRIILAVLLAFVISKPLELKMFESEINGELILMEQALFKKQEDTIKARFTPGIQLLNQEIKQLKTEVVNKEKNRDELRHIAQQEADGTGGSMRRNLGPIYQVKKQDADRIDHELASLKTNNDSVVASKQREIAMKKMAYSQEIEGLKREKYDGLAARIDALGNLTRNSQPIYWANLFILFLFIAIETAPVFVKLIGSKGPYDDLLHTHEHGFDMYRIEQTTKYSHDTATRLTDHVRKKKAGNLEPELDPVSYVSQT
jgi:hypothetical protein